MSVTDSFQQFTNELRQRLNLAESLGMSVKAIKQRAEQLGDYLAENVDPRNPEQRLLRELWQVADQQEQQAIASTMLKLVQKEGGHIQ